MSRNRLTMAQGAGICLLIVAGQGALAQEADRHTSSYFLYHGHWAYTYLDLLRDRGLLPSLSYSTRPYRRMEVAEALEEMDTTALGTVERSWLRLLAHEFRTESGRFRHPDSEDPTVTHVALTANAIVSGSGSQLDNVSLVNPEFDLWVRHFALSARGRIDRALLHDPAYRGRKTDYFGARLEDAYGHFQFGRLGLTVGRWAQEWGPFGDRSLVVSSNPYTLDQIGFSFHSRAVLVHSAFGKLEPINGADRFFSAHRLDIRFRNGMQFGFTESVVYGGPNAGMELAYLNPFSVFANAQLNESKEANENIAFDFYVPVKKLRFLAQVLVDDLILDGPGKPPPNRKTSSDRLGYSIGMRFVGANASQLEWRYSRIGSYTYNVKSKRPWQSYTYEGKGLGYPFNDTDAWEVVHTWYPVERVLLKSGLSLNRRGQRSLLSNDFEDSTFIKLPFPSGVVERSVGVTTSFIYQSSPSALVMGSLTLSMTRNDDHERGRHRTRLAFRLSAQWNLDRFGLIRD